MIIPHNFRYKKSKYVSHKLEKQSRIYFVLEGTKSTLLPNKLLLFIVQVYQAQISKKKSGLIIKDYSQSLFY